MERKIEADKICSECGTVLQEGKSEYFCDVCKRKLGDGDDIRRLRIFWKDAGSTTDDIDCCSWRCVFAWLRSPSVNVDSVDFIVLPYISSGELPCRQDLKGFWEAIKEAR